MQPGYLLRFDTVTPPLLGAAAPGDGGGGGAEAARSLHATADYASLSRVAAALDAAADEIKTAHARRVQRYIR